MADRIGQESSTLTDEALEQAFERLEASVNFNCEHVVPQSWFDRGEPMRGDLHHLFTCWNDCNSFRQNHPYWEFTEEKVKEDCGQLSVSGEAVAKFEPKAGKGAVARATMYFILRYPKSIGNKARELPAERLPILRLWHLAEPPTRWELHRNAAIFAIQGNRNPFIDFPDSEFLSQIDLNEGFGRP